MLLSACASLPTPEEIASAPSPLPGLPLALDGRAVFRDTFCALAHAQQPDLVAADPDCEQLLWRLPDEPAATGSHGPADAPSLAPAETLVDDSSRVFIVGGAFSDCFGSASQAYRDGAEVLRSAGADVVRIPVSGRSSAEYNAAIIARELQTAQLSPEDTVILLGYSKGTVDILQFLAETPAMADYIDAVISVAGPTLGSATADTGDWVYDVFIAHGFSGHCDPGDGGVIDALVTERRQAWWRENSPPAGIRFYSLLGIATEQHLARALRPSWRLLADQARLNDGQVTPQEGWVPGSTLLGFAHADHWSIAVPIEEELEFFAARPDPRPYPRSLLFQALVRYVVADLSGPDGAPDTRGKSGQ
ncbi:hypothetical protein E4634_00270 [Mangrovimicrobium sediminis]|uniref:Alpha/beta hydrolase n=1 Tax=Mangrovimicrobium sediminis TaxID=2562682 RepID=A0A4Z0M8I9_9GAMM|nr:hypothetical protein [Haliea sp. SAOS-164]TGD76023.1 hypothetical protein E4634_00270 [Haliea sp. SAOS-164]